MELSNYINKNKLHHAYLLPSWNEDGLDILLKFLEKEFDINQKIINPDFKLIDVLSLGIGEGREIKDWQIMMPVKNRKICVIKADNITHQAQNSLLKVFEEPTQNTHFFLLTPSKEKLLPTLLSRLYHIPIEENITENANSFLKMDMAKRLDFVKSIIEEKSRKEASILLTKIEQSIYKKKSTDKLTKEEQNVLGEINKCLMHLNSPGSSIKLILEYISLITHEY